jgi:hypothetical protein
MSAERDVNRIVRTWLEDGVMVLPERVLDQVLDQVPSTRQERRGFVAWRTPSMSNALKLALAAAAVIAVVVAGFNLVPRSDSGIGGTASPTPSVPASPAPPETSSPTPSEPAAVGTDMFAAGFEERMFSVLRPPGWYMCCGSTSGPGFSVIRNTTSPPDGASVYFYAPTTTYSDPCAHALVDPPVGPSVDDFVQALREIPNMTTTEPAETTLGGLPATYLEMTSDDALPCSPNEFWIWDGNTAQGPGQVVRTWVLELDGRRIVASALRYPGATEEMLAEQQSILDSIEFE